MADTIELTDLEVISRYSLAVRAASADRADVIAALRADLAWLEGGRRAAAPAQKPAAAAPVTRAPVKKAPAKKAPAKKAPAKKAAAKKVPAKKAPAKKTARGR